MQSSRNQGNFKLSVNAWQDSVTHTHMYRQLGVSEVTTNVTNAKTGKGSTVQTIRSKVGARPPTHSLGMVPNAKHNERFSSAQSIHQIPASAAAAQRPTPYNARLMRATSASRPSNLSIQSQPRSYGTLIRPIFLYHWSLPLHYSSHTAS